MKAYKLRHKTIADCFETMNVTDRRRILGPSSAKPLVFEKPTEALDDKHVGHKTPSENETMYIEKGLVSNSNGSSYLEINSGSDQQKPTILLTAVYGPRPSRGTFSSKASLSVQFKEATLEEIPAGQMKEMCNFLSNIFNAVVNLERYPKSGIDIFISLIQNSVSVRDQGIESVIKASINGITLALVDAGIEIFDTVTGGLYKGNVAAFVKNGTEVVGLWKDYEDDVEENILEVIENCRTDSLKNRKSVIEYLLRSKEK